jgi:molybdopterin-guanine dinucleotide biosynthesis protein A
MRSAIILAGGRSTRMNRDKGLKELDGELLINRVIRLLGGFVDEIVLVVGSQEQGEAYAKVVEKSVELVVDIFNDGSPLVGAITGFKRVRNEFAIITACDMPFISDEVVEMLFEEADGHNGATFLWPNGWIEPLFAVYRVEPSLKVALDLYKAGDLRIRRVLQRLPDVRMIPIENLKAIDPEFRSLFDADTEKALLEAENILKKEKKYVAGNVSR